MNIDLKDPAVWAELERQAYDGTVNLPPLPPAAYKYFAELTELYRAFRFDGMPKEEAENRKRLLRKAYDEQVAEIYRAREVYAENQNAIRQVGTLMSELEKTDSVFELAEKASKIVGLLIGDRSFYGRQIRKITCEGCTLTSQQAHNKYDMLKGCVNRMFVTDDLDELIRLYPSALHDIEEIRKYNTIRLAKKEENNER